MAMGYRPPRLSAVNSHQQHLSQSRIKFGSVPDIVYAVCGPYRAVFLLLWSGQSGGVPFSLRGNGHDFIGHLYTDRKTAV